jgi:hypothetical protein
MPSAHRLPLAATLAAALLAACGGGGGSAPPPPATCDLPPTVTVGGTESYRLIGPADWPSGCSTLTVQATALGATERLGVLLVNAGGLDNATPTLTVSGTSVAAAAPAPVAAVAAPLLAAATPQPHDRSALEAGEALVVARRRAATAAWLADGAPRPAPPPGQLQAAATAAPVVGDPWKDPRGPCVFSFTTNTTRRSPATLRHVTSAAGGHVDALFYVTDAVWTGFQNVLTARPDFWATLDSYFEGTVDATRNPTGSRRILPALHESFGVETDIDGNGALIFLFADLGRTSAGAFTVGYFDATDVERPVDTTAGCTDPVALGSNGADMLYLLDPCTFNKDGFNPPAAACAASTSGDTSGFPYSIVVDQEVPGTMAHELQHDVIYNTRCSAGHLSSCPLIDDPAGDLWMNEGLAMTSEDFAGFGLNTSNERGRVGRYLNCARTNSSLCYQDVSLTVWPASGQGDPTGHYGGAHAFLRWHADQADAGHAAVSSGITRARELTKALVGSPSGSKAAFAAASGLPFEEGFARFAVGALFSGEDAMFASYPGPLLPSPFLAYATGVPWSPLHAVVGAVKYTKLQPGTALPTSLHADGWGAYASGLGTGATATLTVTSSASVKPRVAVVRFKGTLP